MLCTGKPLCQRIASIVDTLYRFTKTASTPTWTVLQVTNQLDPDTFQGVTRVMLLHELLTAMGTHLDTAQLGQAIIEKLNTRASKLEVELRTYIHGALDYYIPELIAGLLTLTDY